MDSWLPTFQVETLFIMYSSCRTYGLGRPEGFWAFVPVWSFCPLSVGFQLFFVALARRCRLLMACMSQAFTDGAGVAAAQCDGRLSNTVAMLA